MGYLNFQLKATLSPGFYSELPGACTPYDLHGQNSEEIHSIEDKQSLLENKVGRAQGVTVGSDLRNCVSTCILGIFCTISKVSGTGRYPKGQCYVLSQVTDKPS